jgi:hypothetical protein
LNGLSDIHAILFNAHILFSFFLGAWAASLAATNRPISGNYWGAIATSTILAAGVLLVGIIMTLSGLRVARLTIYFLYMLWLVIIMPGLFTLMRGRDDRSAGIAFAVLGFFNAATSVSMWQRGLVAPWLLPDAP